MVKPIYYLDYKRIFIILTLFFLLFPYLNIKFIYILCLQIILLAYYKNTYTFKLNCSINHGLLALLLTLIANLYTNYKSFRKNVKLVPILYIPYRSKLIVNLTNNFARLKLYLSYMSLNIPTYVKHIFKINVNYLFIMHNLFMLIKREKLSKNLIKCLSLNFTIRLFPINYLSILLSSQLLQQILESIKCMYIGIKIKNPILEVNYISSTVNSLHICLEILSDITYSYNITLWTKLVNFKFYNRQFTLTL